jgi:hypothetical protein
VAGTCVPVADSQLADLEHVAGLAVDLGARPRQDGDGEQRLLGLDLDDLLR